MTQEQIIAKVRKVVGDVNTFLQEEHDVAVKAKKMAQAMDYLESMRIQSSILDEAEMLGEKIRTVQSGIDARTKRLGYAVCPRCNGSGKYYGMAKSTGRTYTAVCATCNGAGHYQLKRGASRFRNLGPMIR